MRIRTAIFTVYVAASALGLAVLMGFVLRDVRLRYVESMRRTLADTATVLAALLESGGAKASGDDLAAAWRDDLPALARTSGTLRVYVTDVRGRVLYDGNGGRDVGKDYDIPAPAAASAEETGPEITSIVQGELRVLAPVKRGQAMVGYVGVGRPLVSVADAIWRARVRLALGAGAVALVLVIAGWWIASKLTHSLERLTTYAQTVRDGQAARPPASRAKEIAALSRAFEEMRVALEGKAYVERYTQALAHELKAPLSAIRGAAELLGEEMPREERARFIANLRAESARVQRVVDQLLELAALEARRGPAEQAEIDLRGLAEESVAALRGVAEVRGVTLALVPGAKPRVRGERVHLGHAVGNLIQNAIEFSPAGGTVDVEVAVEAGRAICRVDDAGPGVPAYAVGRVFDRFYSLPRPDTGRKSSGLGLSIVREVALLHSGEATLENRADGGARATLALPLA
ncbi:MAG: two-component system sensor histidine kinase CreC [Opitutaceae bacterium]|nr:two-component system sensor histidine kinase CreC [Opitutaceae bacterium]